MEISVFLIITIVILFINIALLYFFKDRQKVDEGFEFFYHRLSYRRKFIRTLYTTPLLLVVLFIIYFLTDWNSIVKGSIMFAFVCLFVGQAMYNYILWKKHKEAN